MLVMEYTELGKIFDSTNPLTNPEIRKYYQNESKFKGVYSRNSLPNTVKDGAYVVNFD